MELFSFEGRIRRRNYWIISFVVGLALGLAAAIAESAPFLYLLIWIPLCWIELAAGSKRCHDLGHNGWWQLIPFYTVWMAFKDGEPGGNKYGPNPKKSHTSTSHTPVFPSASKTSPQSTVKQSSTSSSSAKNLSTPWSNGSIASGSSTQSPQNNTSGDLCDSISSKWK